MKKKLFEQNGGTYTSQGNYMLPDVKLPAQPEFEIGVWGNRCRQYLKQRHRVKYYNMLTQCTLYPHLADVERRAHRMFDDLVDQIAKQEGITEQLKATNQMEWVKQMNCVRLRANEIVFDQVIHC